MKVRDLQPGHWACSRCSSAARRPAANRYRRHRGIHTSWHPHIVASEHPPSPPAGVGSFINPDLYATPASDYPGGAFHLLTAADSLGLAMAGSSVLLFRLEPCTILQPHIHPHAELAFALSGAVTVSVVYNNGSFTTALENTQKNLTRGGFAVFPAGWCLAAGRGRRGQVACPS